MDQFGVQLQELDKIAQDWQSVSDRTQQLSQQLGKIQETLAKATTIDLASSAFAGIPGFAIAFEVAEDVKSIEQQARRLLADKERLTKEIAQDAEKIKAVRSEYEATEKAIEEKLKKHQQPHDPGPGPKQPTGGVPHGPSGAGSGGSGHHHGGHGGGDGAPSGGAPSGGGQSGGGQSGDYPHGHGTGNWNTSGNWNAGIHGPREGRGILAEPKLDGVPQDRQDIVNRALERIQHKIGYSQTAYTDGYRDDCSGFVSAAWGLPGPGLNTIGLMEHNVSHRIGKDELQPGDALIADDHTVLFGGWADAAHTRYVALEDDGSDGTVAHVIPYPYWPTSHSGPYYPYRRNGL